MRVVAWLASAFWLGAACSGRGTPPATPAAAKQRPPAPAATEAAPAWMQALQAELSALRGLSFTRPVPFSSQTRAQFRDKVRGELTRELPADKATGLSRAYAALGFVPTGFDLTRALEEAVTREVLAYYEPETRAFRVIADGPVQATTAATTSVLSHELVHALQDQNVDLRRFLADDDPAVDEDQRLARKFVVEGEATFLMMAHGLARTGAQAQLGNWSVAGLRVWTRMVAAMDLLDLPSAIVKVTDGSADPSLRQVHRMLLAVPGLSELRAPLILAVRADGVLDLELALPAESLENIGHVLRPFMGVMGGAAAPR